MELQNSSGKPDLSGMIDAGLYPDLIDMGGVVSAIESIARENGLDMGRVCSQYSSGSGLYTSAEVDSDRGRVSILLGVNQRSFSVEIYGRGFSWVDGATSDLAVLVRSVAAWRGGMPLHEFAEKFPTMRPTRLAWAYDSGDPISAQWDWLRTSEDFSEERFLMNAAYESERLRQLFPYLSHGTLCLTVEHGVRSARVIRMSRIASADYRVEVSSMADSVRRVQSLGEAVSAAVDLLN